MRLLKKMISAFLVVCMVISMLPMVAVATETGSDASTSGRIILDQSTFSGHATVWIDGIEYAVQNSGGSYYVDLPADSEPSSMVTYSYHIGDAADIHTQYPIGMQVWELNKNADGSYTPEKVDELNNILQYSGSSIRITGNKGIRMITSIEQNKKSDLTSGGLGGYKLLEYGTVLAWSSNLAGGNPLVLGQDYAKSNYAYKKGVADPVFAYAGNLMQYTNVLVGFTLDECKDDIAMRPYMILEDEHGEQMTIYGGIVHRSIGYIAWQNKDVFTPGSAAYNYVWEIIRHVYAEVTFQTNGGSTIESVFVEKGTQAQMPTNPVKEGYSFAGWCQDEALTEAFDWSNSIDEDLTLYAKWEEPITRGQWIQMLVDAYGYPSGITGNMETYADIGDSEYRSAIETAVAYDILEPEPQSNFDPEKYATREFAAVTSVNAMGYYPIGEFDCADASEISDPAAVKQAINSGFMDLEDGYFYPNRALSRQEAERILGSLEDEFNSANDSDGSDTPEGIVYLDGVVNKPSLDWEIRGNKMIIPEGEELPEVGTIITFGTEMAIRVESVDTANGQTTITYSKPEFNEFLDYIDLEGEALMDLANFVPAEGIVVTQNTSQIATYGFADDLFDIPAESISSGIDITLEPADPIELTEDLELSFSVDLKIPTVSYKFDVDFDANPFNDIPPVLVKNAYIKASNDITTHISIGNGFDTGDEEFDNSIFDDIGGEREFNLGSVPLIGIDGLCVEVEVDLIVSAEGKFDIAYNVHGTAGAQVLNNELKNITALQSSMSLGIEAEVSAGPQIGFEAEIFGEDIFSFAFGAGGKAAGSVNLRSTGMVCMDGNAHVYLEIKLLEDCLIDDWLEIGVTYPIWKEDNSPFKIHGHWENLHKVPECTYENFGTIKGTVANADNRTQYIPGAVVKAFDHSDINSELVSVISDNDGRYTAQIKDGGTVLLRISANGYIPFECLQTVGAQQEVYLETFLMVEGSEDSNDTGTIGGIITNAVTGSGISGITMSVYKGWNMTTGQPVETTSTNSTGRYSVTLPIGNYTILLAKDGYITKHFNVAVTKTGNTNCGASMNPDGNSSIELGDMRIILRWTDEPSDLDSHLWGPTVDGESMFHTYYRDMSYYENGTKHAYLDRDDVDYNGPETTTVYNMTPNGTYSFFIHDFTNRNRTGSTVMANSGAYVEVYIGENNIATYYVPTSGVGNVWHVFDFDAVNGTITGVNAFSSNSDPSTVGSPVATFALRPETVPDKQTAKETTEDTAEETTEAITEDTSEETTEAITEDTSEETTEVTTEGIAKETTEDTAEKTTEITKEDTAEDTTEEMVEEGTEDTVTECSEENSTV